MSTQAPEPRSRRAASTETRRSRRENLNQTRSGRRVAPAETRRSRRLQQNEQAAAVGAHKVIGATLGRKRPATWIIAVMAVALVAVMVALPLLTSRRTSPVVEVSPTPTPTLMAKEVASPLPGDAPLNQLLEVAGRIGAPPVVKLNGPIIPVQETLSDVVNRGTGRAVNGGEPVMLSVSTYSGADGTNTTGNTAGRRLFLGPLTADTVGGDLSWRIVGLTEGTRLVLRSPVTQPDGKAIVEITVIDIMELRSHGTPQPTPAGMPSFTMGSDGKVTLGTAGLPEPTAVRAELLIEGEGEQIKDGDTLVARYTMVNWKTGQAITDCYGDTMVPCGVVMKELITAAADHLRDVRVGSRVLMALPAAQARGDVSVALAIDVLSVDNPDSKTAEPTTAPTDQIVVVTPSAPAAP
ncbi:Uncharacterised protein [Actinomyces bovis]|uniref:Peptidylprolyl isomerase n=1 Tax=Actinomyces bovis TaxID=1658 RepID=A0ABY1VJW4_9ACTO|nr:hypothetical protein [Actinomyces bovis]SPT52399.1 Uncharacterised protein [Actinomyces bovis]VEG54006.1 Uncharacterised protein [Actinomyces israelii]